MTDRHDPLRRLVELSVYAPIGAAVDLRRRLPELIESGRQRVKLARFVGKLAVDQLTRKLAEPRRQPEPDHLPAAVPVAATAPPRRATATSRTAAPVARPAKPASSANRRRVSTLPIDDYDSLAASQIVARLPGLTARELGSIGAYEVAHRNRRTVLGKIAQLQGR